MSVIPQEDVLVVLRSLVESIGKFQGFCEEPQKYLPTLLDRHHTQWMPRSRAEEDPSFKQLIPYCVLRSIDKDGASRFFAYTRGGGQHEARLRAKRSIGVGGHSASTDGRYGDDSSYDAGMRRELDEEIEISCGYRSTCVGLINDDSNAVGQVHLGVVHVLDLEAPLVTPREQELVECGFESLAQLLEDRNRFETWSQITLDAISAGLLSLPIIQKELPPRSA